MFNDTHPSTKKERRVKDKNKRATGSTKGLGNVKIVFSKQLEEEPYIEDGRDIPRTNHG